MLKALIADYAASGPMLLQCPAAREPFYARHGFLRLFAGAGGALTHMAGAATQLSEVRHLVPRPLQHLM